MKNPCNPISEIVKGLREQIEEESALLEEGGANSRDQQVHRQWCRVFHLERALDELEQAIELYP